MVRSQQSKFTNNNTLTGTLTRALLGQIFSDIRVDAYGSSASLNKLAQVSVRDGRTLTVNVFDESTSVAVERAIRAAGLNLNPVPDGPAKLKVPIPKPTEKARQDLTKVSSKVIIKSSH